MNTSRKWAHGIRNIKQRKVLEVAQRQAGQSGKGPPGGDTYTETGGWEAGAQRGSSVLAISRVPRSQSEWSPAVSSYSSVLPDGNIEELLKILFPRRTQSRPGDRNQA